MGELYLIMKTVTMALADGTPFTLNSQNDPVLAAHLARPQAVVHEMIDQINRRRYYEGLFEERSDQVFLDLGANLGLVSIWASPRCRRVVSVEAEPATYGMLCRLTMPLEGKVECVHRALAPLNGMVAMAVDPADFSCHTTVNPKPGSRFVQVPGLKLADLLREQGLESGIDVCKVDVEGAEMRTLNAEVFRSAPVKRWYIEVHRTPKWTREQSRTAMIYWLKQAGFNSYCPRANAIVAVR